MIQEKPHTAQSRLASYGTLAPGECNYHQMDGMEGEWSKGSVRGRMIKAGWGVHYGFPGFILDPQGPEVPFHIFQSFDLPDHWARLDAFEGEGYFRTPVMVQTKAGEIECSVYLVGDEFVPLDERQSNG